MAFSTEKKAQKIAKQYDSFCGLLEFRGEVKKLEVDKERKREDMRKDPEFK